MAEFSTIFLIILGLVLFYMYKYMTSGKSGLPGPTKYPLFGSALLFKKDTLHETFFDLAKKYGSVFELKLFSTTNLMLNSVDAVNKAFCADGFKQVFNSRPKIFIGEHVYCDKSITLKNPDKFHGYLRKALSKGLHVYGDGIPKFEKIIKGEIYRVMEKIEESEGKELEFIQLIIRSMISVMSIWLIGEHATESDEKNFFDFTKGQDYFVNPITNVLLLNMPFLRRAPFFKPQFDKVMESRRNILEKLFYGVKESRNPGTVRCLVDWYLEQQDKEIEDGREPLLTDDVIKANVLDILTAGILTTSSVIPNTMLCLLNHPEYQTRIQEELDRVIGPDREPCVRDKHNCPFLEAVIMESMRHLPPVPLLLPHMCTQDTEFDGYFIKANTQVIANIWYIHHDEEIWGDPWVFRPERFLGDDGKLLPNTHVNMKSWLPFGTGRRKCPGISLATSRIFLYMAFILKRWTFTQAPGKCVSCDPRDGSYDWDLQFKPKPYSCLAKRREF